MDRKGPPWFRVKRYGYGVGLPIAWQGWLVLIAYIAAAVVSALLLPAFAALALLTFLTPVLLLVVYLRSDADWRWRNGP